MAEVQGLHVGVAVVLAVPRAVVVERHALGERVERPADVGARRLVLRRCVRRLVDVVAEVQQEVEVVAVRRCTGTTLKKPALNLAHDTIANRRWSVSVGERPGAGDGGVGVEGAEAVLVGGVGLEPGDVDVHGPVGSAVASTDARADDVGHRLVFARSTQLTVHRIGAIGRDPGPEHDPVGQRVAARDAVDKRVGT